ncbi:hypothetical protein [Halobellus sp. GM3]|uniref:hypothetical protein n=1 Tax=Halobellus sp. GM3 TaxID=3458410 RepID=UPI00403E0A64
MPMRQLRSCDFCGGAAAGVYEVLPPELSPTEAEQRRIVLCADCLETLEAVLDPLLARLGVDASGESRSAAGPTDAATSPSRSENPSVAPDIDSDRSATSGADAVDEDDADAVDGDDADAVDESDADAVDESDADADEGAAAIDDLDPLSGGRQAGGPAPAEGPTDGSPTGDTVSEETIDQATNGVRDANSSADPDPDSADVGADAAATGDDVAGAGSEADAADAGSVREAADVGAEDHVADAGPEAEAVDVGTGAADVADAGADTPTEGEPEDFRTVMRLLGNREFPVDRDTIVDLAASAYDLDPSHVERILEYATDRGLLADDGGTLERPD